MSEELSKLWEVPEIKRIHATILRFSDDGYVVDLARILPLTSHSIFDRNNQSAVEESEGVAVDQFVRCLEQARFAFESLHSNVSRTLEHSFSSTQSDNHKLAFLTNGGEPYKSYDQIGLLLDYLCEGLKKDGKNSAPENAKRVAEEMPNLSGPAKRHSSWAKVRFVETARNQWLSMTKCPAPFSPSPGTKFFEFVGDLILALEQDWDAESTIKAYNSAAKKITYQNQPVKRQ